MTPDSVDVGWAVAGVLLVASGLGLCLRAKAFLSGGLFALAGAVLIATRFAPTAMDAAHVGVAAMAVRPPRSRRIHASRGTSPLP